MKKTPTVVQSQDESLIQRNVDEIRARVRAVHRSINTREIRKKGLYFLEQKILKCPYTTKAPTGIKQI